MLLNDLKTVKRTDCIIRTRRGMWLVVLGVVLSLILWWSFRRRISTGAKETTHVSLFLYHTNFLTMTTEFVDFQKVLLSPSSSSCFFFFVCCASAAQEHTSNQHKWEKERIFNIWQVFRGGGNEGTFYIFRWVFLSLWPLYYCLNAKRYLT